LISGFDDSPDRFYIFTTSARLDGALVLVKRVFGIRIFSVNRALERCSLLNGPERMNAVMSGFDRGLDTSVLLNVPLPPAKSNLYSLASVWARRYVANVAPADPLLLRQSTPPDAGLLTESEIGQTAAKLQGHIRSASAQAWARTESLLSDELQCQGIPAEWVNPWEIAGDSHHLFEQVIRAYGQGATARQTAQLVNQGCGQLRAKYMAVDPRLMGFVSMQCHYTGQMLLAQLSDRERSAFTPYLKVLDDHLYLPLREAYQAAAKHEPDSEALRAVQRLLAVSTKIARKVYKRVRCQNPHYQSYSGSLAAEAVKVSSIRDIEMFQLYLCVCLLEGDVRSVQTQLFPLCVMLYPRLNVSWQLVQQMLEAMGWEMHRRLLPGDMIQFLPYLRTLSHMFSQDVFVGTGDDRLG
jgi:Phycobilisome protein